MAVCEISAPSADGLASFFEVLPNENRPPFDACFVVVVVVPVVVVNVGAAVIVVADSE